MGKHRVSTERRPFGQANGTDCSLFTIRNSSGASLAVTAFGATAVQMNMPAPSGALADVILGFDTASAEEIARAILFFATDVPFATGSVFSIDGGTTAI